VTLTTSDDAGRHRRYWRRVLRRTLLLLGAWLLVGPILGILLVDRLNALRPAGMPLGFWIAQQGAIYVFVLLIFVYARLADRADRAEGAPADAQPGPGPVH
jgi:putative solute:sodium symporter small subunit